MLTTETWPALLPSTTMLLFTGWKRQQWIAQLSIPTSELWTGVVVLIIVKTNSRKRSIARFCECWLRLSLTFERDAIHQRNHSCQFQHELFKGFLMTRFWSFHSVFSLCYRVGAMPWRLLSCKGRCHVGVEWIFKIVQYKLWGSLRSWKHGRN